MTKNWVRVCELDQVPTDRALDLNINGQRLVLARCGNQAHILQGFCSHMAFPLAESRVDECVLTCGLHRSQFDVRDGSVIEWATLAALGGDALAAVRERKALRTYEVRVMDGTVYILWATDTPEDVRVRIEAK